MLKIRVDDYEDIAIFLRDEKDTFFHAIITAIKKGWKNKVNVVSVAEFAITNSESIINIDIEEEDWPESLYLALYHYEDTEEYEKCIELRKLINNVVHEED
jgi:hypothetical protein